MTPEQLWHLVDAGDHGAVATVLRDMADRLAALEDAAAGIAPEPPVMLSNPAIKCPACGHWQALSYGSRCEVCDSEVAPWMPETLSP